MLARIAGKFILSLNDTPGVRHVFKGSTIEKVTTRYSVNTAAKGAVGELLISNFK